VNRRLADALVAMPFAFFLGVVLGVVLGAAQVVIVR
jgi:hypothetical protein